MRIIETRWFSIGEKLFDLILINTLIILFSIPIITIGPALVAGSILIKEWSNGYNDRLIMRYFNHFRDIFFEAMILTGTMALWGIIIISFLQAYWKYAGIYLRSGLCFVAIEWVLFTSAIIAELCSQENHGFIELYSKAFLRANGDIPKLLYKLCIIAVAIVLLFHWNWLLTIILSGTIYILNGKHTHRNWRKEDLNEGGI